MTQNTCFVSIVGAPNAGKSTLTNAIVGSKVSIVTPKVQTTRSRVTGIAMHGNTQMVLIDTPGIFKPAKTLDRAMVKAAWGGIKESDMALLLIDASRYQKSDQFDDLRPLINGVAQRDVPAILVLNKIDKTSKNKLLELAAYCNQQHDFVQIFMISALTQDGVADLIKYIANHAQETPWPFDPDEISTVTSRFFATEITREKLMMQLQHELPYELTVTTESWEEKNNAITIRQAIYVQRENQKAIIIGKRGSKLKQIGEAARKELETLFGCKVHLFLFVKVDQHWQQKQEFYHEMGLDQ